MIFKISSDPIDPLSFAEGLHGPGEGAIVHFLGVARESSHHSGQKVIRLEYEAYEPMAQKEMKKIFEEAEEKFALQKALVLHRVGRVEIGKPAVAIAVAAPHRAEAFAACRYLIDELKRRVPLWKKEIYQDGSQWVGCRP